MNIICLLARVYICSEYEFRTYKQHLFLSMACFQQQMVPISITDDILDAYSLNNKTCQYLIIFVLLKKQL